MDGRGDIDRSETHEWLDGRWTTSSPPAVKNARASCSASWPIAPSGAACRFPPPSARTSTPSRGPSSRPIPATARSSGASRASSAGTPWRWWCAPTEHEDGIGGHISTYASAATLLRGRLQPLLPRPARSAHRRRPGLLPGPRLARHLRPRLSRRPALARSSCDNFRRELAPGGGLSSYPHPWLMPDFWQFPTVSMGLGPIIGDLPGALQPLPRAPRPRRPTGHAGLGLPRRRRDRRARIARRDHARRARKARQPDLRRQLQPAAARRPGARQRQDHPGARSRLPRRRLERDQGDLGRRLGSAARPRTRTGCWSSAWARSSTASTRSTRSRAAPTSASTSSARTRSCCDGGRHLTNDQMPSCGAAATTRKRSTPPTRPPPSTRERPPSSSPRPSRATAWARPAKGKNITHQQKKLNEEGAARLPRPVRHSDLRRSIWPTRRSIAPPTTAPRCSTCASGARTRRERSRRAGLDGAACPQPPREVFAEFLAAAATAKSRPRWPSSASCASC